MPKAKQVEADTPIKLEVVPRRGLRRGDAARYVGISTTKFDACVKDGWMKLAAIAARRAAKSAAKPS